MPPKRPTAASGIQTNRTGERIIPASVRSDGSIRPERKVKQGYVPVEDVSTYKSEKAESFRSHQYGHKDYVPPGLTPKKPVKKIDAEQVLGIGQEDPEKKARVLRKKIKAALELKERAEKGDKLQANQIAKIGMLETFQKELAALDIKDETEES